MARTTLKQLAAELGMSASSVSEILNRKSKKYKAATIERVFEAASKHKYLPSISASMISKNRYNSIALVTIFPERRGFINDSLIRGIQTTLLSRDYHLIMAPVSDTELTNEKYIPKFLKTWMVDGVLVLYWQEAPERLSELLDKYEIPAIWVNCKRDYDCVYTDEFTPVKRITEQLIESGVRDIAYANYHMGVSVTPRKAHFSFYDRRNAYESAMKSAGLKPQWFGSSGFIDTEKRMADALAWFKSGKVPSAIFASFTSTALPIYCAALKLGIEVPDDLSIITFGDTSEGLPIKTLLLPWHELGLRATEMLLRKINDPERKRLDPLVIKI